MNNYDFTVKGRINGENIDEVINILSLFFDEYDATIDNLVVGGMDGLATLCKNKN